MKMLVIIGVPIVNIHLLAVDGTLYALKGARTV